MFFCQQVFHAAFLLAGLSSLFWFLIYCVLLSPWCSRWSLIINRVFCPALVSFILSCSFCIHYCSIHLVFVSIYVVLSSLLCYCRISLMSVLCNAKMACRNCRKQTFVTLKGSKILERSVNEVATVLSCQIKASFNWTFATDTFHTCKLASNGNVLLWRLHKISVTLEWISVPDLNKGYIGKSRVAFEERRYFSRVWIFNRVNEHVKNVM